MSGLSDVWFTYGSRHDVGSGTGWVGVNLRMVKDLGQTGLWAGCVGCDPVPLGWVAGGGI
ncbi:MAG: hypothetical protein MRY81_25145 [Donghicola eburneus]|nr:hypothetical protein [Donghicola eburneus]MCI5042938.1 hypothetical protein [Donghicola eburneus]